MAPLLAAALPSLIPMASGLLGNLFGGTSFGQSAGINQSSIQNLLSAVARPQMPHQAVLRPMPQPAPQAPRTVYVQAPQAPPKSDDMTKYLPLLAIGAVAIIAMNRR